MKQKGVAINEVDFSVFREKMRPIVEKPYIEKNGDAWLKKINASLAEKSEKKNKRIEIPTPVRQLYCRRIFYGNLKIPSSTRQAVSLPYKSGAGKNMA